jgi:hypothetical protein
LGTEGLTPTAEKPAFSMAARRRDADSDAARQRISKQLPATSDYEDSDLARAVEASGMQKHVKAAIMALLKAANQ